MSAEPASAPQRNLLVRETSAWRGGLLLLRHVTSLTRRHVVYFCSGAYNFSRKACHLIVYMCYITPVRQSNQALLDELKRWFIDGAEELWPVALGSLSLRKSPCIRKQCSACASGHGHLSYALSGYQGKRRFSIYVPDELAPEIEKAIENGRQLQELMKEAGLRYIKERKRARQEKR